MFTLIKNADLYTPDHMGRRDLLICNDKIVKVAPSIEFDWDGLQVIDAAGRRVIPARRLQ